MKIFALIISLFFFDHFTAKSQIIYVSTTSNAIFRLNIDDCSTTFVCQCNRQLYDIAFHPDGSLYGISGNGNFFEIDTVNCSTNLIFNFSGQSFNSLTIGADGLVYTIGNDGELWTYNLLTSNAAYLGDIGYSATGDLTFYGGQLYCAVTGDRIVRIPLSNPTASTVIINDDIPGNILGIVSDVVSCTEINSYTITNGLSDIYAINFETLSLDLVCELDITVGGGASTSEFLAASPLLIDTVFTQQPTCTAPFGSATIVASGGYGVLEYSLNSSLPQPVPQFTALGPGMYNAVVMDQTGCQDTFPFELSLENGPRIDSLALSPATCGLSNGMLSVYASGGTPAYNYTLNGGPLQTINSFTGLTQGQYIVAISDQNNCTDTMTAGIQGFSAPVIDSISASPTTCGQTNGVINIFASQGAGTLLYAIAVDSFQSSSLFTDIAPASYLIYVTDSLGCQVNSTIDVAAIPPVFIAAADIQHTTCGASNGEVEITTNIPAPVFTGFNQGALESTLVHSNLSAGNYILYLLDQQGCLDSIDITILPSMAPVLEISLIIPERCNQSDGGVEVQATGTSTMAQYSLDSITFQLSNVFANLSSGSYTVFMIDENGCQGHVDAIIPDEGGLLLTDLKISPADCNSPNGGLSISAESAFPPIRYGLNTQQPQLSGDFAQLTSGNYDVHLTDEEGCTLDTLVFIPKTPCPIYIPNVFSPNGDGINDLFQIQSPNPDQLVINRFYIFDRWGNQVFEKFNIPADTATEWWDGTFKGATANPGVYAYFLEVQYNDGSTENFKGDITLIR